MSTIRPPVAPPAQLNQARAAFFRPVSQTAAVVRQPSAAVQTVPQSAPAIVAPQPAPDRPLRPGSIIDIRV